MNPLTIYNLDTKEVRSQENTTPLTRQLEALFNMIPEEELLKALKVYYAGQLVPNFS